MTKKMAKRLTPIRQTGMVSIVVTLVMMIVLSLIVISFSQIMRREQRQALDKQLETQAFYAAESGVNAAIRQIQSDLSLTGTINAVTDCNALAKPALDTTTNSAVTCILINPSPTALTYSPIPVNTAQVVPINAPAASTLSYIELAWQNASAPAGPTFPVPPPGTPTFPSIGGWTSTGAGVLRIDLVPVTNANTLGPAGTLYTNNQVLFLYPIQSGSANVSATVPLASLSTAESLKGSIIQVTCHVNSLPNFCLARIPIAGAFWSANRSFYMRIVPIYTSASVTITAYDATSTPLPLSGTQAVVDATGRGADVLKRVSVHVPLIAKANTAIPNVYAIDVGTSLCKLLSVSPTNPPVDGCP